MSNKIYAIGHLGGLACYLNVSRDEAIQRYVAEYDEEAINIKEIEFNNKFCAYDIWKGDE